VNTAQDGERFSVRIEFRTVAPRNANERWDIDNLVKPTLDAMEGVFGARDWSGVPQPADDRVDHLEAWKRQIQSGEHLDRSGRRHMNSADSGGRVDRVR
jgi:hypothetical protein